MSEQLDFSGALNSIGALDGGLNAVCRDLAIWRISMGADARSDDPRSTQARLMGIVAECAEAYEAVRADDRENLEEEMADIFIRWAGLCGLLHMLDIEDVIRRKMTHNLFSGRYGGMREAM